MTPLPSIDQKTVREVVRGLIALAFLIWLGIFATYFHTGRVDPSFVVAATGITGGLVGVVSLRHGPDTTSNVDAPNADTVNVQATPSGNGKVVDEARAKADNNEDAPGP